MLISMNNEHISAKSLTSFNTGGEIEHYVVVSSDDELLEIASNNDQLWVLGDGANSLVSDHGLPGVTIHLAMNEIRFEDGNIVIADAGTKWTDLVDATVKHELWGLELMSGIPGSVGAAIVGNIAAYGQAVSDSLLWVETVDFSSSEAKITRIQADKLDLSYRSSSLATDSNTIIIIRAAFQLDTVSQTELKYESAAKIAAELGQNAEDLNDRQSIIMEARRRAGSLLDETNQQKTAGSFFKNPMVSPEQAEHIMQFEERQVTKEAIKKQNEIHGGDQRRVSAAHVVLASGFHRGQTWGPVRIHPEHALKLENTGGATSQQIYDVSQEIITAAKEKLNVTLEPEIRFLGKFD